VKRARLGDTCEGSVGDLLSVDGLVVTAQEPADQGRFLKAGVVVWDQDLDPDLHFGGGVVSKELLHKGETAGRAHRKVVPLPVADVAGGLDQRAIDHCPGERAPLTLVLVLLEGIQRLDLAEPASLWTAATKKKKKKKRKENEKEKKK